jgi:hypothetical protein
MSSSHSIAPANTKPPMISGTPSLGETLLCAGGLWTGSPTPSLTDRWLRDGVPIAGATGGSYRIQSADAGHGVACEVTARSTAGEESAVSLTLAIPGGSTAPTSPINFANPTVTTAGKPAGRPDLMSSAASVTIAASAVVVSGGSAPVYVRCSDARCQGSVELTIELPIKHRTGKKRVSHRETLVLARGSFSLAQGTSATAVLRLTTAGKQRLAQAKRHPLAAEIICSVRGGKRITRAVMVS